MKILNIDIACGFTLLFSIAQGGHNPPNKFSFPADEIVYAIDTPTKDSMKSEVPSLDSIRQDAEEKVKNSLEETRLRIARLKNKNNIVDTVYECETIITNVPVYNSDRTHKKTFFNRLFNRK